MRKAIAAITKYAVYANHCAIQKKMPMTFHSWKRLLGVIVLGLAVCLTVKAQSSQITLTNPYYQICVNVNPATQGFNCQFDFNPHGLYKLYPSDRLLNQFLPDRRLASDDNSTTTRTWTGPDANGIYHVRFQFSGYDEILNATGEVIEDAASGTIDWDFVPGAPGCKGTCWHEANVTATINY